MPAVTPLDPSLKDRVLSDIAGGMRPKAAAEKYGVKLGTIGQWCARAGLTLGVRKKAEKVAVKVKGGKVEKPPVPAADPPSATTARAPPRRNGLDVDALEPKVRRTLQAAILRRINKLASEESLSLREQRDIAVTLAILIDKTPGILDAHNLTRDDSATGGPTDEEMDALDALMLTEEPSVPALRVVPSKVTA